MENQQAKQNATAPMGFLKDQLDAIQGQFRRECRKIALQTAEHINPVERNHANQLGPGQVYKPSITQILSDADKIYEWLIKELS